MGMPESAYQTRHLFRRQADLQLQHHAAYMVISHMGQHLSHALVRENLHLRWIARPRESVLYRMGMPIPRYQERTDISMYFRHETDLLAMFVPSMAE